MIYRIRHLIGKETQTEITTTKFFRGRPIEGKEWVRAVPEPFYPNLLERFKDAWAVFCGQAYAVKWPKPGELEEALGELDGRLHK